MRGLLVVLALLPIRALAQCVDDDACKGDRVCRNGQCVDPLSWDISETAGQPVVAPPSTREPKAAFAHRVVLWGYPLATLAGAVLGSFSGVALVQLPVEIEYGLQPNLSVYIGAAPTLGSAGGVSVFGLGLGGGARFFPLSGAAPRGVFVGGGLGLGFVGPFVTFDVSIGGGYRWLFDNGFSVGVGGGLNLVSIATGGFPVYLSVPLGYAF